MRPLTISLPSRRYLVAVLTLTVAVPLMVLVYYVIKPPSLTRPAWYTLPAPCRLPDPVLESQATLALNMHEILQRLKVPHALCYGTLWGALRHGRTLPWDTNVDFCALDVHLAKVSDWQLKDSFSKKGVMFSYDWRSGIYHLRSHREAEGHMYVFTTSLTREKEEVAFPAGWVNALRRGLGQKQLSFPAWLLQAPFDEVSFNGQGFPVPHGEVELLKYLYPDDWWLEVKPPGC